MIDDTLLELYSRRMKALGETVATDQRLETPTTSLERRSPLCGSVVRLDVRLDDKGRLAEIGYAVKACAVAAAATGLVVREAIGCSLADICKARDTLRSILKEDSSDPLQDQWQDMEIFRPVQMVPSRHASVLLPFETLITAMEQALDQTHSSL